MSEDTNFWLNIIIIVLTILTNIENVRQYFMPKPDPELVELRTLLLKVDALLSRTNQRNRLAVDGLTDREHSKLVSTAANVKKLMRHFELAPESLS